MNANRDETINILSTALTIPKPELREMMNRNTYSMVVDNGVVKSINVEQPGAFEVSSAEYMLNKGPLP